MEVFIGTLYCQRAGETCKCIWLLLLHVSLPISEIGHKLWLGGSGQGEELELPAGHFSFWLWFAQA